MATYVNNLRLKEIATGAESGTWGTSTNTNLELIGEALGFGTEAITTNADTHTTTVADGSADEGRAMYIKYTGTLDSACTITIGPNTLKRVHIIENATSGSQNIIIKQASSGGGDMVTIAPGTAKVVYLDGGAGSATVQEAFAHLAVPDLTVEDDLIVADNLTLNSDSSVINMGAGNDVTFTHDGTTGLTIAATDAKDIIFQQYDGTAVMTIEDNVSVNINNDVTVAGRATGTQTTDDDGDFDLSVSNFFKCTPSGNITLTFSNPAEGQSGTVMLINTGGHTISAHASVAINADILTALTTAGTYMLNYYCSASSGDNTILVGATGALT
jgi:plastocyanin